MYSFFTRGAQRRVVDDRFVTAVDRLSLAGRARINGEFVKRPIGGLLALARGGDAHSAETMLIRTEALGDSRPRAILERRSGRSSSAWRTVAGSS